MIIPFLLLLILSFVIFLISKAFIKNLFLFFFSIFRLHQGYGGHSRAKFWAIQLTTLILLPGTIVHEISHLIIAETLRVRTGEISFIPQIGEEEVKAGSLKIASVDPFRRTLVGLAPLLAGLTIIFLVSKFYLLKQFSSLNINQFFNMTGQQFIILFVVCYLLFAISNTMFSSKKDLEAAALPAIIIFMIFGAFYLGGFSMKIEPTTQETIENLLMGVNLSLGLIILIDVVFMGILKLLFLFLRKSPSAFHKPGF